jgi:hypothetical protein
MFLLGAGLSSQAAIIASLGQAPGTLSNINLGDELTATTIDGTVNGLSVLFTGQNPIDIQGGGQANIEETSSPIAGGISFTMAPLTFTVYEVSPQRGGQPPTGAILLVSAVGTSTVLNDFPLALGPGENRLYVQGIGESLVSVLVEVQGGDYDLYKQPRVGGIADLSVSAVPEPSSMGLIGAGLVPISIWLRKRYRRTIN